MKPPDLTPQEYAALRSVHAGADQTTGAVAGGAAESFLLDVARLWPDAPAAEAPPPAVLGRYRLARKLGQGGFGIVYLAEDTELGRPVALKLARLEVLARPDLRARFRTEALAAAALDHPNIVPVYDVGEAGPLCYIVSAYCPGNSLADWLRERPGPTKPSTAAGLVATLADAVAYTHSRGFVHRDLKPANVLLAEPPVASGGRKPLEGREADNGPHPSEGLCFPLADCAPKITDFGLAKLLEGGVTETPNGALLGTPLYMAPEQVESGRDVGPSADVYALGVILYELLTGRPPFPGTTPLAVLDQVLRLEPVPPTRLAGGISRDLESITLKCLEKDPARRYATAADLAEDLRRFQQGLPILARPARRAKRLLKWIRRQPTVAASVGLAFATGAALIVLSAAAARRGTDLNAEVVAARRATELSRYAYDLEHADDLLADGRAADAAALLDLQTAAAGLREFTWGLLRRRADRALTPLPTWHGHEIPLHRIAVSPDGRSVATSDGYSVVKLWDATSGTVRHTLAGFPGLAAALAFTADSQVLAIGCGNKDYQSGSHIYLHGVDSGARLATIPNPDRFTCALAFTPDGKTLVAATHRSQSLARGELLLWDVASRQLVAELGDPAASPGMLGVALFGGGAYAAVGTTDGTVQVWDLASRRPQRTLRGPEGWVDFVAATPSGYDVAAITMQRWGEGGARVPGNDRRVWVWNATSGSTRVIFEGHPNHSASLAFSADGRYLLTVGNDKTVILWDVTTGQRAAVSPPGIGPTGYAVAAAHDGCVYIGWEAGQLGRWEPDKLSQPDEDALKEVWSLAFSPDGRSLAVGADDANVGRRSLFVLDGMTGRKAAWASAAHRATVSRVAFAPNGQHLFSASLDNTLRCWDAGTGRNAGLPQPTPAEAFGAWRSPPTAAPLPRRATMAL